MKYAQPTVGIMSEASTQKRLVVIGAGMVAQRLVEALDARGATDQWDIEVFGEESRPPYDRVALTSFFSDRDPDDLLLGDRHLRGHRHRSRSQAGQRDQQDVRL